MSFDPVALGQLPDAILAPGPSLPHDRKPRLVATGYGGSVRQSFSGSSLYLGNAGIDDGSLEGCFTLFSDSRPDRVLQGKGALWKARRLLRGQRSRGFKFSEEFSSHLWRRHLTAVAGTDVISNFQLFSEDFFRRRRAHDVGAFFYLDGTLHDYLRGYREFDVREIDDATVKRAIEVERDGYQQADGIAVMSRFVANSLVDLYGVAAHRITMILPGANVSDEMVGQVHAARQNLPIRDEFTVGFIGVYPERKGLPKLASAVALLRGQGVPVRLQVVGRCPADIAAMAGVEAVGFVNKATEPGRFADALAKIDLGCQLSTVELSGIATLEYLRCGIPVLATEVGGIPDILAGGGTVSVPVSVTVEQVADAIRGLAEDSVRYRRLAEEAAQRSGCARWHRTASALGELVSRSAAA